MESFNSLVDQITSIGLEWHKNEIVRNSQINANQIDKTIDDLPDTLTDKSIIISAGPSLHFSDALSKIGKSSFQGKIICIDGSYIKCLKAGIIPDYVVTLDPHPTRMVRWFGDPEFIENSEKDDYFSRQDLDIDFRNESIVENLKNIELVNLYAHLSKLIISVTAPTNLVNRAKAAGFDMYWWTPLVDDPDSTHSLTREMYLQTKAPALNTGGNVGTAAWLFAKFFLAIKNIAVVGMDLGYRMDLPKEKTQTFQELKEILGDEPGDEFFPVIFNPHTSENYYIDPTYNWYLKGLLEILEKTNTRLTNCSGAGNLFGDRVDWVDLDVFLGEFGK